MRILVVSLLCALASTPAHGAGRLQVEGNRIVDAHSNPVFLRGVNTADPDRLAREGRWNEGYFQEIAAWAANVVRFPVHPQAWRERGSAQYLELLDQGIGWARALGLYVIIDWHSIGNLYAERFQAPMYRTSLEESLGFWETIARRYAAETTVAAYELFNEPTTTGENFGAMTWGQWKGLQNRMIEVIRRHDPHTIILVAGFDWAYDLTPVATDPVEGPNLAYVSHPYPQKRQPPWEPKWEAEWGFVADRHPVLLTEIGFCLAHERGAHVPVISTEEYGRAITAYAEKKGLSWMVWVFDTRWAPMLILDWDFTPSTQGRFFRDYLRAQARR